MEISVADAAQRLQVDESRVRQLLRARRLVGRQVAGRWLVDEAALARLAARAASPGRPMAPGRAWALLDLLDGGSAPWLSPAARSQVRALLKKGVLKSADASRWYSLLAARADVHGVHAHPAALDRLLADPNIIVAGAQEAIAAGADLVALAAVPEVYVPADRWPSLAKRLHLSAGAGNPVVRVRVPRAVWPFADHRPGRAVLAADLLEADDPRAVRAGLAMLTAAARAAATAAGSGRSAR